MENTNTNILASSEEIDNFMQKQLEEVAKKYHAPAAKEAHNAQVRRVSRRLLLSIRAQKLTCVCKETGIVTLLEVPAIPNYAAEYAHPLSNLANSRGLAQRGLDYLRKLDSQVLAGICLVLASSYNLFRFQEGDSGAFKNAVIRTAGKDLLIDAILIIENQIHSGNAQFLPRLSLVQDINESSGSIESRFKNYLELLTEAIRKPDLERYDENAAPKKIGRPVYIKDVEAKQKKLSYLARQEVSAAKKLLLEDSKQAKNLASNLVNNGIAKAGLKPFINQLFADNGMGLVEADPTIIDMLVNQKLILMQHKDAEELIKILRKDRSILKKQISELDELDDPTPGNETAIDDSLADMPEMENSNLETGEFDSLPEETDKIQNEEPTPPAGLSIIGQKLWLKKWKEANQPTTKSESRFIQQTIPSVHKYTKAEENKKQESLTFAGYNADRMFLVYSSSQVPTGIYYIMNDFGDAVFVRSTLPIGRE